MQFLSKFVFQRTPKIVFGPGEIEKIGSLVSSFGSRALIVRGASSLKKNSCWDLITQSLYNNKISFFEYEISGEPSPDLIDTAVNQFRDSALDCVVAIGGGSVIDSGKAVSAMLPVKQQVTQFLELVGNQKTTGVKVPFIAVPTTSGTGSEASANAVISKIGVNGFKRSLRHENYIPDIALVDPELSLTCPPKVTAACGMDALTQLIEAYLSPKATPFTDALIESALPLVGQHLVNAVRNGSDDLDARIGMSYSSLVSGIALANAGLGVVHGLASLIGALFPVPHGIVCGTLLAESVKANISKLGDTDHQAFALKKYARAGRILLNGKSADDSVSLDALVNYLDDLTKSLEMPYLSGYGIAYNDIDRFLCENVNKNNPVQLSNDDIKKIISLRIM